MSGNSLGRILRINAVVRWWRSWVKECGNPCFDPTDRRGDRMRILGPTATTTESDTASVVMEKLAQRLIGEIIDNVGHADLTPPPLV